MADRRAIDEDNAQLEVVCIGETMAMVTPEQPEPLEFARTVVIRPGGAESNVAMYLASLGHRVAWASRLGDDPLGRRVLRDVGATGVDTSLVEIDTEAPTGVFFKDPNVERRQVLYYRRGSAASLMTARLVAPVLRRRPRAVHLTGITPALSEECDTMMEAVVRELRASSTPVSFDVNYRQNLWGRETAAEKLMALAQQSDIVFVGLDEARELWSISSADELRRLINRPGSLVVKDGAVGASVYHDEVSEFVPAPAVAVCEPVGAGDAFAAGWLSGLLRGFSQGQRLRMGHLVAASALASTADHQALPGPAWFQGALSMSEAQWQDTRLAFGPGIAEPNSAPGSSQS